MATTPQLILLIDDDKDLLRLMKMRLIAEGFHVMISPNCENVLDIIQSQPPDVIMLDIHMEGIEGGTLCRILKDNYSTAKIPVIMASANANIAQICKQCGADDYIEKPFNVNTVKLMINKLFKE